MVRNEEAVKLSYTHIEYKWIKTVPVHKPYYATIVVIFMS
jgi:hypothetical protein